MSLFRRSVRLRHRSNLSRVAVAAAAITLMAACGDTTATNAPTSTSSSTGSASAAPTTAADPAAVAATIKKLFLTDVPAADLNPAILQTVEVASRPWTEANQATLMTCMTSDVCETGTQGLVVAFPNDNINPWRQTFRAEFTAQAIQSGQVSKVIYSLGTDVASWLANFKSLIAQRPDIIVMNSIYGPAILPAVQQAKAAGIVVVEAETPLPDSVKSVVDVHATSDLCAMYTDAAQQTVAALGQGKGYGLYTGVPGNASAAAWQPCLTQGLESAGWTKAIEGFTQWTPQGMTQAANSLFASGNTPAAIAYDYTMEYFADPYLKANQVPPVMISDVINYAYLKQSQDARAAGVQVEAFVANSRSWYGRIGLTAGLMIKSGQAVDQEISIPYPSAGLDDVLSTYDPAMPANAPVPTMFTAEQEAAILAAGS